MIKNTLRTTPDPRALTREQELALATRWRTLGDRAAGEALARAHLGLVVTIAHKYQRYAAQRDELIAEGNLGLSRRRPTEKWQAGSDLVLTRPNAAPRSGMTFIRSHAAQGSVLP